MLFLRKRDSFYRYNNITKKNLLNSNARIKKMEIKFKGFYTKKDVYRAVNLANLPDTRRALTRIGFTGFALILYAVYAVWSANQKGVSIIALQSLGSHFFFLLLIGLFQYYPNITSWVTATKIWRAPTMHNEYTGVISGAGIFYTGKKTLLPWNQIDKKEISRDLVVLLTSNGVLSFFPRNFFKSDAEWQQVIQLVNSKAVAVKW